MKTLETSAGLKTYLNNLRKEGTTIGLVPTMGALHEGHLSLVDEAIRRCDVVVVSIFVNPTQFNDPNDLKNYPRTLDRDLEMLSTRRVDVAFIPEIHEIYPHPDDRTFSFGHLETIMEGAHRPGHFNGVAQVVSILLDLVKPEMAFFGQKDFQQLAIIKKLVKKMKVPVEIVACPIIRESDGLAMSSRNQLLDPEERKHASHISKILFEARERKDLMEVKKLKKWAFKKINEDPLIECEYFEIVNDRNLKPIQNWDDPEVKVACVAAKINKVRLIDNLIFD